MKTHCRCRGCGARRKLKQHPDAYRLQPSCLTCGRRDWRKDEYRHRVEIPQMRTKTGRYKLCPYHCFHFEHRIGSTGCQYDINFNYRDNNI